jgi:hypothetical protein
LGKTVAEKLEVIWEADERSKIEVAQTCGIPLTTLLTCLKNRNLVEQQAVQGVMFQVWWEYMVMWRMVLQC